jgi:predicted GIY-YIG superfamily endonuclease
MEERDYDKSKVTNKFAVGEQIEWVKGVTESNPGSDNSEMVVIFQTGIIKEIYKWVVVLEIDGEEKVLKKVYLENSADDPALAEAIVASLEWNYLHGRPSKTELPPNKPRKSGPPHDIYRLRDPRDKAIFYIGISKNSQRRYKQHLACVGLNFKLNIRIQEILQCGLIPEMEIIEQDVDGTERAKERERFWIRHHQSLGDVLTNIADCFPH